MKKEERLLAIIPARSGSKGIKDKNIRLLNNKPLISYTIEAARKSNIFEDIVVSTDSDKYKKISEESGAWVPFLRRRELAGDESSTNDVIIDLLVNLRRIGKEYDSFMVLQPTSPLRNECDICEAARLFYTNNYNSVVSMCECSHSPVLSKRLKEDKRLDGFLSNIEKLRRQDLECYYRLNGAIYISKVDYFLKYKDFYRKNCYAYIMSKEKSVDIDDIFDFKFAEFLLKANSN